MEEGRRTKRKRSDVGDWRSEEEGEIEGEKVRRWEDRRGTKDEIRGLKFDN
jgi:hypothetical protein